MNLKHISAATAIALLLPFAASALTADDIQQQITNLLSQIKQLQEQLKLLQTNPPPACTADAYICPDGTAVGRSGPNCTFAACPGMGVVPPIRPCPQILRTLNQGVSGSDVSELQTYLGVSPTGYFGPMTANAVAQFQSSEGLSKVGIVGPQTRAAFARRCGGGNQNGGGFSASPTSGAAPLAVNFTYVPKTDDSGQYYVDFGDGGGQLMDIQQIYCIRAPCVSPSAASHTYTSVGVYNATVSRYIACLYSNPRCMMAQPAPIGTVTIVVRGQNSSGAPSISGLDAPTSLSVGQSGTWAVHASTGGGNLSYYVRWGDEPYYAYTSSQAPSGLIQTSGSFTHAYAQAGTYQPTFTVSNGSGSAQTSASVVVGGSISANLSASPTSGSAPLSVSFNYLIGGDIVSANDYRIDFGDGTTGTLSIGCGIVGPYSNACPRALTGLHTYTSAGTYTASLVGSPACRNSVPACMAPDQILGSVTITVGGNVSSCPVYSPPLCNSNQHLVDGTYNSSTGCYGAPQCVMN